VDPNFLKTNAVMDVLGVWSLYRGFHGKKNKVELLSFFPKPNPKFALEFVPKTKTRTNLLPNYINSGNGKFHIKEQDLHLLSFYC
jgi:hypothetical protein